MSKRDTGMTGENIALAFLEANGFSLRERNYRTRQGEIDLVMSKGDTIVFVEVKYRRSKAFGTAAEGITPRKRERITAAANAYLGAHGLPLTAESMFAAVTIDECGGNRTLGFIENIFA
ncbi:MAG: YraN family protein [Spirochaetes bacterium]|nr:YraN family protein [Spirochaetota bacterium]